MGLDIFVRANQLQEVFTQVNPSNPVPEAIHDYALSRTFCWLMCRADVIEGEPELDQIGRIARVDIAPLYAMTEYSSALDADESAAYAETQAEKQEILQRARGSRDMLENNIDLVSSTVEALIQSLTHIHNLPERLNNYGNDSLDPAAYFSSFELDLGDGYIGNNFGQDLRNLRSFLVRAKSCGIQGVHFAFG